MACGPRFHSQVQRGIGRGRSLNCYQPRRLVVQIASGAIPIVHFTARSPAFSISFASFGRDRDSFSSSMDGWRLEQRMAGWVLRRRRRAAKRRKMLTESSKSVGAHRMTRSANSARAEDETDVLKIDLLNIKNEVTCMVARREREGGATSSPSLGTACALQAHWFSTVGSVPNP